MKTNLQIVSAAFIIFVSACGKNTDMAEQKTTPASNIETAKFQKSIQDVNASTIKQEIRNPEMNKIDLKKSELHEKSPIEEKLAETIDHAQEITKTKNSVPRLHAQNAEEEMTMELNKQKQR